MHAAFKTVLLVYHHRITFVRTFNFNDTHTEHHIILNLIMMHFSIVSFHHYAFEENVK